MNTKTYIPALKYDWLTKLYDPLISTLMPEKEFKNTLIEQSALEPGKRFWILDVAHSRLRSSQKRRILPPRFMLLTLINRYYLLLKKN